MSSEGWSDCEDEGSFADHADSPQPQSIEVELENDLYTADDSLHSPDRSHSLSLYSALVKKILPLMADESMAKHLIKADSALLILRFPIPAEFPAFLDSFSRLVSHVPLSASSLTNALERLHDEYQAAATGENNNNTIRTHWRKVLKAMISHIADQSPPLFSAAESPSSPKRPRPAENAVDGVYFKVSLFLFEYYMDEGKTTEAKAIVANLLSFVSARPSRDYRLVDYSLLAGRLRLYEAKCDNGDTDEQLSALCATALQDSTSVAHIPSVALGIIRLFVGDRQLAARDYSQAMRSLIQANTALANDKAQALRAAKLAVVSQILAGNTNLFFDNAFRALASSDSIMGRLAAIDEMAEGRRQNKYVEAIRAHHAELTGDPLLSPYVPLLLAHTLPKPVLIKGAGVALVRVSQALLDQETAKSVNREEPTCSICLDPFSPASPDTHAYRLSVCDPNHFYHAPCVGEWIKNNKSCPQCRRFFAIQEGTMPPGRMHMQEYSSSLSGHEGHPTLCMSFSFPPGVQGQEHPNPGAHYPGDERVAFLPGSPEGRRVYRLFQLGWERRLLFKIGHSETRGQDGIIVYASIHMKSAKHGAHGYPDPGYLKRVTEEFAARGCVDEEN